MKGKVRRRGIERCLILISVPSPGQRLSRKRFLHDVTQVKGSTDGRFYAFLAGGSFCQPERHFTPQTQQLYVTLSAIFETEIVLTRRANKNQYLIMQAKSNAGGMSNPTVILCSWDEVNPHAFGRDLGHSLGTAPLPQGWE